jgi:hypothetical protein
MTMIPDKLFINLKILSKIQKNGRITRSSDGVIALENETFYQSIKRFVTSDSRKQAIFEINSIITETIECLNHIVNSKFMNKMYSTTDEYYKNCENMSIILKELILAKNGIDNLKFTYTSDANISSQLDILILKINTSIKDMNHKLSYFQSFLPNTYKLEIEAQNNITPNYYINETVNTPEYTTNTQEYTRLTQLTPEHIQQLTPEHNHQDDSIEYNQFAQDNFNTILDMGDVNDMNMNDMSGSLV